MSELDLDNVSLPSEEVEDRDGSAAQHRRHIAFGTLRIPADDELVTVSEVNEAIRQANGRYHILDLQHAELGDHRMRKVLEQLRMLGGAIDDTEKATPAKSDSADNPTAQINWFQILAPLSHTTKAPLCLTYGGIRNLSLDGNALTSDCLPALSNFLSDNLVLHSLSLKANAIDGKDGALSSLARAIGRSALRRLYLSNNLMSWQSLTAFFDSIPANGTALEELELSHVLVDGDDQQALLAAQSIADFIADPQRCRSLLTLKLNGNAFCERGVYTIKNAIIGGGRSIDAARFIERPPHIESLKNDVFFRSVSHARWRHSNRQLIVVGLSGTTDQDRRQGEEKEIERIECIRRRYAAIPLEDIGTIVSFLHLRARDRRLQGNSASDRQVPFEVACHLTTIGVTLDEWWNDLEEASELFSGVKSTSSNHWLSIYLENNNRLAHRCERAAYQVLRAARVTGCRVRLRTGESITKAPEQDQILEGFPRFLDLPPEIRLHILRQLDEGNELSASQFLHVVRFACDRTTIGYGTQGYDWSHALESTVDTASKGPEETIATLPVQQWSWSECFALRATPRDWLADTLDAEGPGFRYRREPEVDGRTMDQMAFRIAFLESTLTHRAESN